MFAYKIANGRYVAEVVGGLGGDYVSNIRIDCTRYMPDENGAPIPIPASEPEIEPEYTPTLEEVKAQKHDEINFCKNQEESATPFIYLEKQFDFDSLSRERLNVAIQLSQSLKIAGAAGTQKVTDWKLYDNTMFEFTVDALCGMPQALAQRSDELHQKAWTLKAQIDAATTVEEVNAINW